jgi:CRISPR/Cas system-associated exonuclease Cas4 (RecB family)
VSSSLRERLQAALEGSSPSRASRAPYLGASLVGQPCEAFVAFQFRGFPQEFTPRTKRIFELGKAIEDIVTDCLNLTDAKSVGILELRYSDPKTHAQYEYVGYGGHVIAHPDGKITDEDGEEYILEIKSMNDSEFTKFREHGIISHHKYEGQVHCNMALSGINKSIIVAYNKDNSEFYVEVVEFDLFKWAQLKDKIERVLDNQAKRIGKDKNFWRCKTCSYKETCWDRKDLSPNSRDCRNCKYSMSHPSGGLSCLKGYILN